MKQHSTPVVIKGEKEIILKKVPLELTSYCEDWIQNLCYKYPSLLPFTEIEPYFDGMIPICRELQTESGLGRVDLIYINEYGLITIGECKLWKNPEARRKVVGQILDYAKDLAKWDYSKFESMCLKARKRDEKTLLEIIQNYYPDIDEADFINNVQKSLEKGRFLLLIIGDGIQENMEDLVQYIHRNENLHFTLGLIELPVYKNPTDENELIITPRILAKTTEIKRTIYQTLDKNVEEDNQTQQEEERSQTISEKVFYERLAKNIGSEKASELELLIALLDSQFNIKQSSGRGKTIGTINLKLSNGYNFGIMHDDGIIHFLENGRWKRESELFNKYIKKITNIVNGQFENKFIKKIDGRIFNIPDLLEIKDKWMDILTETIEEIYQLEEND
jgi:hypothetical protein